METTALRAVENVVAVARKNTTTPNLSFGFSRLKMDNFSGKFRRFVLENSQLTIPCEQISEICLETLPIFIARKPKTQVINKVRKVSSN